MASDRTARADEYRAELRARLTQASPAERREVMHELARLGASVRRWRNRAVKADKSPEREALRKATRDLEAHDRCGGTAETRAALVAALKTQERVLLADLLPAPKSAAAAAAFFCSSAVTC